MKDEDQLFWKFGKTFPKGTVLFREGDTGEEMFIIQRGKVQVRKRVGTGEEVLAELGDGEFFGEMALLIGEGRSATVEVIEESKVLVIRPDTFSTLLKTNVDIAIKMLKKMASRLKATDKTIEAVLSVSRKENK